MKNAPKNGMMGYVMRSRGENGLARMRPIPGFTGLYLAISPKKSSWHVDGVTLHIDDVVVISTSNGDYFRTLNPWRKKKNGKPYGARWVALMDDHGNKKYFKLEALAEKVDCHRNYVGRVERGEQNLTVEMLWRFADALGCDAASLLAVGVS